LCGSTRAVASKEVKYGEVVNEGLGYSEYGREQAGQEVLTSRGRRLELADLIRIEVPELQAVYS